MEILRKKVDGLKESSRVAEVKHREQLEKEKSDASKEFKQEMEMFREREEARAKHP